ncbi:glycosyltransferase [Aquisphaera insulae]|uniref:glycosyltransferase n=1 Tax=Aquisphaera insulae TaxID=2712864 RepID=UPI0013ECABB1|nr:glycosyltransferase [Aquisphaera insulae]
MMGGTETQLLALIRNLDRSLIQPYLALLDGEEEASRALEPAGCPVTRLGVKRLLCLGSLGKLLAFCRFLRRERIDVLQVYFPDSTYFGTLAGRLAGVRSILRTRNNINHWMTATHRLLGQILNRWVTVTVCNCEAAREAILADERPDPDSVVVIENGVDIERFAHISPVSPKRDRSRPRRVGMVANLRPVKGVDLFIQAAAIVAAKAPDVTFHVAGEGPQRPELQDSIKGLGLVDRLQLHGRVDDIPMFLAELDVAVLSSRAEGMPNALLEYMAAGRPIVAANVGGVPSVASQGVHAWLVTPESPELLAEALSGLLDNPRRAAELAAAGREHVQSRFSRAASVGRFERLFRDVSSA